MCGDSEETRKLFAGMLLDGETHDGFPKFPHILRLMKTSWAELFAGRFPEKSSRPLPPVEYA